MSEPSDLTYLWFWLLANAAELRDMLVAVAAACVVPYLGWRGVVSHLATRARLREAAAAERQRQSTSLAESFSQLGSDKTAVRIAAVYALERHAREQPRDHGPIMQTLAAYVRESAPIPVGRLLAGRYEPPAPEQIYVPARTDVQAALSVLGRRERANDPPAQRLSLANVNLSGYDLADGDFAGANFRGSYLCAATLTGAKLARADFQLANLERADLYAADCAGASFAAAACPGARFAHARLDNANFLDSDLRQADFTRAHLANADLRGAGLDGARLDEAIDLAAAKTGSFRTDILPPPAADAAPST
ncbi:MAG: pentapeptide repeat-containing protein [Rhodospirillales bacterium]|nr:pentapeptide repeat-containing protein [Rhodospirillales bacterium]